MMLRPMLQVVAIHLAVAGCALPAPPTAEVMSVQLTGLGLMQQRISVTLCITNPNADPLSFRQVAVNLDLAGSAFAAGSSDVPIRLAPHSSARVPFTVLTTVTNLPGQLLEIGRTRGVGYRLYGSVALDGALGIRVPYSRSGRLDLAGAVDLVASSSDPAVSRCAPSDLAVPL